MTTESITPSLIADAISHLPRRIRVGAHSIRLRRMTDGERDHQNAWGLYHYLTHEISLNPDTPSLSQLGHVLIHEIMHAIWDCQDAGMDGDPIEQEAIVSRLSHGFAAVYRDNPKLVKWLAYCFRYDHDEMGHAEKPAVEDAPKKEEINLGFLPQNVAKRAAKGLRLVVPYTRKRRGKA